ncbi:MAG: ABC transporter permease subunit [Bdellovibrionales bacterium]|nr:ABC transporter permease subunit [Bdellovibrionales bacterium]
MFAYFVRRILFMIPTFFGITLMCFIIINLAPGSPVEQKLQALRFGGGMSGAGIGGASGGGTGTTRDSSVNQEIIDALNKQYGFDKPVHVRYWIWLKNIFSFNFGESFTYQEPVIDVIVRKFPVSLQFGILSILLTYLVSIPLGVARAVRAGSRFDQISGVVLNMAYAVPPLVFGLVLIVFFAGSGHLNLFPIGGFRSDNYDSLSLWGQILDRAHHFILPGICYMIGSFTQLTLLTRNSLLDVIKQDYIRTARAKGVAEKWVIYKHALRNSLIPVATGIGGIFGVFLAGSLIIETLFNLDGIGLLSYQSIISRDYNVVMAMIFLSSLVLMFGRLFSDFIYVVVDPRIDFK